MCPTRKALAADKGGKQAGFAAAVAAYQGMPANGKGSIEIVEDECPK
jgi:hypothetical protein